MGYTSLWSSTWAVSSTSTWETKDLSGYDVPASAVAIIQIYNDGSGLTPNAGVRVVGSSLDRFIEMHEAEGGGKVVLSMCVQVDSGQDIQCYSEDNTETTFRVIGYFTGVTYTELLEYFAATGQTDPAWKDKDLLTLYSIPANRVVEFFCTHTNEGGQQWTGVRRNGSALERRFEIHEQEGGGRDGITMFVKSDGSGIVENYDYATNRVYWIFGYFSSEMDYVEKMSGPLTSTNDTWEDEIIDAIGGCCAEFACGNIDNDLERWVGVRDNGSALDRRIQVHEPEGDGFTGGRWTAKTDAAKTIEMYEDSSSQNPIYLLGYFIIEGDAYNYLTEFAMDVLLKKLAIPTTFGADIRVQKVFTSAFAFDVAISLWKIIGVTKDSGGSPLGSCTVDLFKTSDDSFQLTTVSDGSGNFDFVCVKDVEYYMRAFKAGTPVFGTTDDITPEEVV